MPKFPTAKANSKKPAAKKASTKKPAAKREVSLPEGVVMSSDIDDEQEVVVIQGLIGSGKTFTAASASEFYPASGKLPMSKMTDLEDMFWLQYDRKATAGFKHNKIRAPTFDVGLNMVDEGWNIIEATEAGINAAAESEASWLVVDTLTGFDMRLLSLNRRLGGASKNHYEPYKLNLVAHANFYETLLDLGMNIIFCCHSRTFDQNKDEQGKSSAVSIAGGARIVPDLTGQAPKIYKRDATLQLYCFAYYNPKERRTCRRLYIGANEQDAEGKNRYEGLLPPTQEPPHLRKLLEKAWTGK